MDTRTGDRRTLRTRAWRLARTAVHASRRPTAPWRPAPNFLIIGAQRCGTTSFARDLWEHPGVMGPAFSKGVHYFDVAYDRPASWYRAHFPTATARAIQARRAGVEHAAVGEGSPYYLFHPAIPDRIHSLNPEMRCFALLRDPVERAWSHYHHEQRRGFEDLSFADAIAAEATRLAGSEERLLADPHLVDAEHQHHSYLARGRYAEQLRRYFDRFGRDRVMVIHAERLFAEPTPIMRRAYEFLDLPAPTDREFPALNATSKHPIDPVLAAELADYFTPYNDDLYELVGEDFGWPRSR